MKKNIPKTDLLITFVAVAQYESYTQAAEKLSLTQSTVFRQIAALEEFLNVSLFNHVRKRIYLSDVGKYYLKLVNDTLDKLEKDTQDIMAYQHSKQPFELLVTPTFCTHWLIPNIEDFHNKHPEIILNIKALTNPNEFTRLKYDAVIMRKDFCPPYPNVEDLFEEKLVPVCSRMLWCNDNIKLTANQILEEFTLLHQTTRLDAWNDWLQLSGISDPKAYVGARFDLLSMLISAVHSNLGIALIPYFAVQRSLQNGNLVIPCDLPISTSNKFILTYKKSSPNLLKFSRWLHDKLQER